MMPRLMTMDELKAWTAATILFLVAVLLAGCASLGPTSKDPYQILANDAVRALHGWPVYVTTFPDSNLGQYYCRGARIELGLSGNARWLIAHELGHHLSGHCDEGTPPEMEANTVAIKVLQVWGDTEADAVAATGRHILGLSVYRRNNPRPGHDYCAELADLARRFPQYPPTGLPEHGREVGSHWPPC